MAGGLFLEYAMIFGPMPTKSTAADRVRPVSEPGTLVLLCLAAWAVPGAGHVWLGRRQKGITFFLTLSAMFAIGLLLRGQLFPFRFSEWLVALAAFAQSGIGAAWIGARLLGAGTGVVTSVTWEYGNTFLIVAGLLNFLVILDAYDVAIGRK